MKPALRNRVLVLGIAVLAAVGLRQMRAIAPQKTAPMAPPAAGTAQETAIEPPVIEETGCSTGCREAFDALNFPNPPVWEADHPDVATPFSDDGSFFHAHNPKFAPPAGFRLSAPLGERQFLTLESYSRSQKPLEALFSIIEDPAKPGNRVLKIASPEHTDGTLLRTTRSLGANYQICARVGFIQFGTGDGANGYNGQETNAPWTQESGSARNENGCYFSAIYRSLPKPHNNALAHYERLAFIDSDNNTEGWTSIWDSRTRRWFKSGWHPVMIGAATGGAAGDNENGPPFRSFAAGGWNRPGELLAADAYKENSWYTVCMTRAGDRFTMRISGDFRYGGQTTYEASLDDAGKIFQQGQPQFWLLGDPHINYYEGSLLVDDVSLSTTTQPPPE